MTDHLDTGTALRQVSLNTPGLQSKRLSFTEIPVIDFTPMHGDDLDAQKELATQVHKACVEVGFFYIKGHGVPDASIERLKNVSAEFFEQPMKNKLAIDISNSSYSRGYIPLYGEKNNEHAKGDIKESFDAAIEIGPTDPDYLAGNPLYGPNQWPQEPHEFKQTFQDYFVEMTVLCEKIYASFALALDLPRGHFASMLDKPLDILRLLRYPPQPVVQDESQIGTGAHSDFDCFTVLYQDPTGGLQVLNSDGEWIDAVPIEGTFLINVGDMLERWTNGQFVSTVHRVINRSHTERYSVVFFAAPNYDTVVECLPRCCAPGESPRYPAVKAGDYIVSRYEAVLSQ